ncbi:MAG: cytochrome c biogenesis protein CcsA [Gammaproteobacteria bacterium]|nr:cytochrome c biogenesis protein CcsA [Gammaproteobacteria bacterium]
MASTFTGLTAITSVAAALLYALGAALQIRSFRLSRPMAMRTLAWLTVPALLCHAVATYFQINSEAGLFLGLFTAASLIALLMVVFLILAATYLPVQNLLVLVLPIAALSVLAGLFGESSFQARDSLASALIAHILFSIVAYSILFMAACQSILLAYQEHALKTRSSIRGLRLLPPLESMESLLFALLWTGIVTLTAAIATGFIFLDDLFAQNVVHHTVLSLISWMLYAALLGGRHFFGWRSRTATYWTLIAFSLLVLGYFGSKFVLEVLLNSPGSAG